MRNRAYELPNPLGLVLKKQMSILDTDIYCQCNISTDVKENTHQKRWVLFIARTIHPKIASHRMSIVWKNKSFLSVSLIQS